MALGTGHRTSPPQHRRDPLALLNPTICPYDQDLGEAGRPAAPARPHPPALLTVRDQAVPTAISRSHGGSGLTQLLYRGASWAKLNTSAVARVSSAFAKSFGLRLTKRGLGRFIPVVGVAAGASLNWLTVEQIADAADLAYRRRFLLDKYPNLSQEGQLVEDFLLLDESPNVQEEDEQISLLEIIESEGVELPPTDGAGPSQPGSPA